MKHFVAALCCAAAFASIASAQLSNYLGPGILSGGVGNVGMRGGEQVDLRFYGTVNGVYDNGLQPLRVDGQGNLVTAGALYGVEAQFGGYGVHSWRTAQLGIDYAGNILHYTGGSAYDSTNHSLTIGYTYQLSRRLYFDVRGTGGIYSNSLGGVPAVGNLATLPTPITSSGLLLFDSRTYFGQGAASMTYLPTARSSLTIGGNGFTVKRQSNLLVGVDGYGAQASYEYRVSRMTTLGASYSRQHFEFPNFFGSSDTNSYQGVFATQFGRFWTLTVSAGVYQSHVVGIQSVMLAPQVAQVLGVSSTLQAFKATNWLPAGRAALIRRFKAASFTLSYDRQVLPGNGIYLTSRSDNAAASFDYSGIKKFAFNLTVGSFSYASLGQSIPPYRSYMGGLGMTYSLTGALHVIGRVDFRQQEIYISSYRHTSDRVSIGLAFSPGSVPLSLW